jgi:hypothetical protein
MGHNPTEYIWGQLLPVGGEVRRVALEERAHMLIAEAVLLLHQIACLPRGMSEQFGAAGVVGVVLNRAQDKFVEAVLREPVDCGKGAMEGAAARLGDGAGQFRKQLVDEIVAAGVSGDCQGRDGAGRRQRVIDFGVGGEGENGERLQCRMLRGGRREFAKSGEVGAAFGDGCVPVESGHGASPFAG